MGLMWVRVWRDGLVYRNPRYNGVLKNVLCGSFRWHGNAAWSFLKAGCSHSIPWEHCKCRISYFVSPRCRARISTGFCDVTVLCHPRSWAGFMRRCVWCPWALVVFFGCRALGSSCPLSGWSCWQSVSLFWFMQGMRRTGSVFHSMVRPWWLSWRRVDEESVQSSTVNGFAWSRKLVAGR